MHVSGKLVVCQSVLHGPVLFVSPLTVGIGTRVVNAITGGAQMQPPNPDLKVQWCSECNRYFDPKQKHTCIEKAIAENRNILEHWLGRYKILENS